MNEWKLTKIYGKYKMTRVVGYVTEERKLNWLERIRLLIKNLIQRKEAK